MSSIASTPKPPYYAVIFTSIGKEYDEAYEKMAELMVKLANEQPGFLGLESAREAVGITVSYWTDLDSIKQWKNHIEHKKAQKLGYERWYSSYKTRISLVERDYGV